MSRVVSPRPQVVLSDRAVVAAALATAAGARIGPALPALLGVAAAVVALARPRATVVVVCLFVVASVLTTRASAGLHPPVVGPWEGWVTLLDDPTPSLGGVRVSARLQGSHLQVSASGRPAWRLEGLSAGERVRVKGSVSTIAPPMPGWMRARHLAGRLRVTAVDRVERGSPLWAAANAVRQTLRRGALPLSRRDRPLFSGFVLGDDRGQAPEVADDFRAAGLTHLLVVSGQNVAFVLTIASPLLRRLGRRSRVVVVLAVLSGFAILTRLEPSVLRAVAMASTVVLARHFGRIASPLRVLAASSLALILIDPLLVWSVGFGLSVGACAGIALLSRPIEGHLRGPRWLVEPLAVTLAAQVGTAPVLLSLFGGIPLASLPANLLALPAAEPLMVWGMTAGLLAGVVPRVIARMLHIPTRVMIWWIAGVARVVGGLPLGTVGGTVAVTAALLLLAAVVSRQRGLGGVETIGSDDSPTPPTVPGRGRSGAALVVLTALLWFGARLVGPFPVGTDSARPPRHRVLAFGKTADTGDIAPNFYQLLSSLRRFNLHCWAGIALVIGEIGPR